MTDKRDDLTPADTPNARRSSTSVPKFTRCPKCSTPETRTQFEGECSLCHDLELGICTRHVTLSACTAWLFAQGHASTETVPPTDRNP